MRNLFILHTQYNIILGTGIMLSHFHDCQNDLIVYAEFKVSPEYKRQLEKAFSSVIYIREEFEPLVTGFWNIEHHLHDEFKIFRDSSLYNVKYDNVFISQDRPLEHLILGRCKQLNKTCRCFDVEEGCYYSLKLENNNPNIRRKWHTKKPFFYRKLRYGGMYFSEEYRCLIDGGASYFDGIYAIFPKLIRTELAHKPTFEISTKDIVDAISVIYDGIEADVPVSSHYVLFFFDLVERYSNPVAIRRIVEELVKNTPKDDVTILLKYHPRETNKFKLEQQENIVEIPSIIPAEKLLCDLHEKKVTVYGNATTSVIVAKKFGFKTISIAGIEGSNNIYMINKFKEMGIEVPDSIEEIIWK